jgi:hypothetical protein
VHLGCEVSVNIVTVRFLLQADMYLEYMTHVSYHSVSTQPILERTRGQESALSELQYCTKVTETHWWISFSSSEVRNNFAGASV